CLDVLVQVRVGVAVLVPFDAGSGVIAIGRDLHRGPRAVLVEPAQAADVLFFDPVPPETELIRLDRVHSELGLLARLDPLGPGVAEEAIRQEPEVMQRSSWGDLHLGALGPVAGLLERQLVRTRWQVDVDRAARPRAGLERAGL